MAERTLYHASLGLTILVTRRNTADKSKGYRRWIWIVDGERLSRSRKATAAIIYLCRKPGQITGLSIMDVLVG